MPSVSPRTEIGKAVQVSKLVICEIIYYLKVSHIKLKLNSLSYTKLKMGGSEIKRLRNRRNAGHEGKCANKTEC